MTFVEQTLVTLNPSSLPNSPFCLDQCSESCLKNCVTFLSISNDHSLHDSRYNERPWTLDTLLPIVFACPSMLARMPLVCIVEQVRRIT